MFGGGDDGGGDDAVPAMLCQLYAGRTHLSSALWEDVLIGSGYVEFFGATAGAYTRPLFCST